MCADNTTAQTKSGSDCSKCSYPCALSTGGSNYKMVNLTNKGWNFFTMDVSKNIKMRNIEYQARLSPPLDARDGHPQR